MTETVTAPRCRLRVNVKRTQRDGWTPDDTTAEIEWSGDDSLFLLESRADLGRMLRAGYEEAVIECRRRNDAEGHGRPAA
jgi:hypothetical protein